MTKLIFSTLGRLDSYAWFFSSSSTVAFSPASIVCITQLYDERREKIPSGKVGCVLLFHEISSSSCFLVSQSVFFLHKILEGGYFNFKVLVFFMCISGRKNLVNELCAFGLPLITKDMTVRLSHTLIMDPANEGTEIRQQEENAALVSVRKVQKSSRISLSRAAVPSSWKLETTSALLSLHFHSLCSFQARFYVFQFSLILIMLPTPES